MSSHICTHNCTIRFTRCSASVIYEFSLFSGNTKDRASPPRHSGIRFGVKLNLPVTLWLPPVLWCMCSFPPCKRRFALLGNQFDCRGFYRPGLEDLNFSQFLTPEAWAESKFPSVPLLLNPFHVTPVCLHTDVPISSWSNFSSRLLMLPEAQYVTVVILTCLKASVSFFSNMNFYL